MLWVPSSLWPETWFEMKLGKERGSMQGYYPQIPGAHEALVPTVLGGAPWSSGHSQGRGSWTQWQGQQLPEAPDWGREVNSRHSPVLPCPSRSHSQVPLCGQPSHQCRKHLVLLLKPFLLKPTEVVSIVCTHTQIIISRVIFLFLMCPFS